MAKKVTDTEIIIALTNTHTQKEASTLLGITPQTLTKRIKSDSFKAEMVNFRRDVYSSTAQKIVKDSTRAFDVLSDLLESENEMIRYNASSKILSLSQDIIKTEDILTRLDALEKALEDDKV